MSAETEALKHLTKFHLVRDEDSAHVTTVYLADNGLSESPIMAVRGANSEMAARLHGWLKSEQAGNVSFGR